MSKIKNEQSLDLAPLGKKSAYVNTYTPSLLFPVPRKLKRDEIGITTDLPFQGLDIWTAFELSWLNLKGKPVVALGEFEVPCQSPNLIESKSFKLYLNSFNNSKFESFSLVTSLMKQDLSKAAGADVSVKLHPLTSSLSGPLFQVNTLEGASIDDLDIECTDYMPNIQYLTTSDEQVDETIVTNLLKSNCLVTGQPDWGTLQIRYAGKKISHEGLLKYVVSLRDHNEFHEQCIERIFTDISKTCRPEKLTVYGRYTRRGGLDINPYRTNVSSDSFSLKNTRLARQ